MKLVLTLLVRNEADIVDDVLRFHFAIGFDEALVIDHGSSDGTTEILRSYEREGRLRLIREEGSSFPQAAWATRLARLAAAEHGANWVFNGDADEFLWPRDGTLREILAAIPPRFTAVRALWRHFVTVPGDGPYRERMIYRTLPVDDYEHPFHANVKVVHRAHPEVSVSQGNHDALLPAGILVREWMPFEVLHFPLRTAEQAERKFFDRPVDLGRHTLAARHALQVSGREGFFAGLAAAPDGVGLERDVRVRDALRALDEGAPPVLAAPTLRDDVRYACERDIVLRHDAQFQLAAGVTRLGGRVDGLERLLSRLTPPASARRTHRSAR